MVHIHHHHHHFTLSTKKSEKSVHTVYECLPDGVADAPRSGYDVEEGRIVAGRPPSNQGEQQASVKGKSYSCERTSVVDGERRKRNIVRSRC